MLKPGLLALLGLLSTSVFPAGPCPPAGYSRPELLAIKQAGFSVASDEKRNSLAIGLLDCTADPDPVLRDGLAYEAIATWLRNRKLDADTIDTLFIRLVGQIRSEPDRGGFRRPFAALLLSEVARADRFDATLTAHRRDELVALAASYLTAIRDYRGFSETEGWRHGVAHGADLVLQLVLNPNIGAPQIRRLLQAMASQVAPAGAVFYHYGEPQRLARAVFHAWRRRVVEDAAWVKWFDSISSPHPFASWQAVFSSQSGLARRHNTLAFLLAMHFYATSATGSQNGALDKMVMQAIRRVMGG